MSLPTRSKTYCISGLHQCRALRQHQNTFWSASRYFRCSSSCKITFPSGVSPSGTARTGRNTPQTKAELSPGTATAAHGLWPYFSAVSAILRAVSASTAAPLFSSERSRIYLAAYHSSVAAAPAIYSAKSQSVTLRGAESTHGSTDSRRITSNGAA